MREIKFRCWDKELKCMLEMEVKEKQIWFGTVNVFSEILLNHNRFIIMQFTGLLDKNKKPIYEGDVVKHPSYNQGNLVVQWDYNQWGLFWKMCNEISLDEDVEVIGDIYSNPDLLNNKEGVG